MLLTDIRHRLTPKAVKIRADFEVSCFTYDGIDAVKSALRSGLELNSDSLPIRINLIAPPLYVLTTQTMDRAAGLEQLHEVLDVIKKSIENQGGSFKIQQAVSFVRSFRVELIYLLNIPTGCIVIGLNKSILLLVTTTDWERMSVCKQFTL
uniref:Eukaryotic translation initiation factor 2 subunit 1 n=1 Tax=Schistosoma haematobium TaxID=6185 RepID=A0A095B1U6_SCHHA